MERLRPSFVIGRSRFTFSEHILMLDPVENVVEMARFPLKAWDENGILKGGIEFGTHKFIVRTLLDLGYERHWCIILVKG